MNRSVVCLSSILALLLAPVSLSAQTFDDGGHHILAEDTTQQVYVDNGTTIEVIDGARLMPTEALAALMVLDGSTAILRDAWIQAGPDDDDSSGYSLLIEKSDVEIYEAVNIRGAESTGNTGGLAASIRALSPYSCVVSGATFEGQDGANHGGTAAIIRADLTINSGSFFGGDGVSSGGFGLWFTAGSGHIATAEMRGGSGGTIGKAALVVQGPELTIEDGWYVGGAGQQSSGAALRVASSSRVQVFGGRFDRGKDASLNAPTIVLIEDAVLELFGGEFDPGRISASGFQILGNAELVVHGRDLSFNGLGLSGTLRDGSPIDIRITLMQEGRVTLIEEVRTEATSLGKLKSRFGS